MGWSRNWIETATIENYGTGGFRGRFERRVYWVIG